MPLFPKIAGPCPYLDRFDATMDGEFCRMCKRQVHDLTDMTDEQRAQFMIDCGGEACVSYTVWMKPALAAAALAATGGAMVAVSAGSMPAPRSVPMRTAGIVAARGYDWPAEPRLHAPSRPNKAHRLRMPRVVRPPRLVPVVTAGMIAVPLPPELPMPSEMKPAQD